MEHSSSSVEGNNLSGETRGEKCAGVKAGGVVWVVVETERERESKIKKKRSALSAVVVACGDVVWCE